MTRELSDNLASLAKQLDDEVAIYEEERLRFVIVLLTDEEEVGKESLAAFEEENTLQNTSLTLHPSVAGPENYQISEDCEITVMMWVRKSVLVNHAFGTAEELDDEVAAAIVEDMSLILE